MEASFGMFVILLILRQTILFFPRSSYSILSSVASAFYDKNQEN
jgi:hypothetical protein